MFLKGFTGWHRSFGGMGSHRFFFLSEERKLSSHLLVAIAQFGRAFPCEGNGWGFKSPWRPNMSYRSRKRKKSKLNRLKFFVGLSLVKLFNKNKQTTRRKKAMRLPGTKKVMEFLRARNRIIRRNNLRINEWVDDYVNGCLNNGEPVNILTQWCISKDLEERFERQGNTFIPAKKERKFFGSELPQIISVFIENGFRLNWWITFNRSYLDSGRISRELEEKYKRMVMDLAQEFLLAENVLFLDWETDVLGGRPAPDKRILNNFEQYITQGAFKIEFQRHSNWAKKEAGLNQTEEELRRDVRFQIACEVEEGNFLLSKKSPFPSGEFLLIPLEVPERYDFFTVFAKDFKQRIVSVLVSYPWRMGEGG